jgi:hypothetical protein
MSPQHLDAKKCKQINVKSRNDGSHHIQSLGLDTAVHNLLPSLTDLQFLRYWTKMPAAPHST